MAAMPVKTEAVGKRYPPLLYAVGREKIREYAAAIGERDPLCTDLEAARAAGYRDLVAPPTFAVVYAMPAVSQPMFDPELEIDFARLVHGGQEFTWGELVVAGDEITTHVTVTDVHERAGNGFFVFESRSVNQDGAEVSIGRWSNVVRGA
jgi:acyl dehydratase